jgi:hypothetical protein
MAVSSSDLLTPNACNTSLSIVKATIKWSNAMCESCCSPCSLSASASTFKKSGDGLTLVGGGDWLEEE